jgi:hypothetical protein
MQPLIHQKVAAGVWLLLALASLAAGGNYYVRGDGGGSDGNIGASWGAAFATIQKAFDQVSTTETNITVYVQESTGSQSYYVFGHPSLPSLYPAWCRFYFTVQGGWTDVDGTPTQSGYSLVRDNVGLVDRPGFYLSGGYHLTPRFVAINRVNFSDVTSVAVMIVEGSFDSCDQWFTLSNSTVNAQSHGVYLQYPKTYTFGGYGGRSKVVLDNVRLTAGLRGGDGIRIVGAYDQTSTFSNTTFTTYGGFNFHLRSTCNEDLYPVFQGTHGFPPGGYDIVKYGGANMRLNTANTLSRKLGIYEGWIRGLAQTSGSPFGSSPLVELDGGTGLQLDGVSGVSDTLIPEVLFGNGTPQVYVYGVTGGGTWTGSRLTRGGRSSLLVRGSGSGGALSANDKLLLTAPPVVTNGMINPFFVEYTADFLTYDGASTGLKRTTYTASDVNAAGATDRLYYNVGQTLNSSREIYAVRGELNGIANGAGGPYTLTIGSGGLSVRTGTTATKTIEPHVKFGANGDKEAVIFAGISGDNQTLAMNGSLITTGGLTKHGYTTLLLNGDSYATLSGPLTLLGGGLTLGNANALTNNLPLTVHGGTLDLNSRSLAVTNLTMTGGTIKNGNPAGSTLTVGGPVTYRATVNAASIAAGGGQPLTLNLAGLCPLVIADGFQWDDLSVTAPVSSSNGLAKYGLGQLYLDTNSISTLIGPVAVNGGMLRGRVYATGENPFGPPANAITLKDNGIIGIWGAANITNGTLTFSGGNAVQLSAGMSGSYWNFQNLVRAPGSRGTLMTAGNATGGNYNDWFGVNLSLGVTAWGATAMLPAYILNVRCLSDSGYTDCYHARYTGSSVNNVSYTAGDINSAGAGTCYDAPSAQALSANRSVYCLRTGYDIAGSYTLTVAGDSVNLAGMIIYGDNTITPNLKFGTWGDLEGLVYVRNGRSATLAGTLTSYRGLTKFGSGVLALTADNSATLTGGIAVNGGTLRTTNAAAIGPNPVSLVSGATLELPGGVAFTNAFSGGGTINSIDTNALIIAASGSLAPGINTLNVDDLDLRGTIRWDYDEGAAGLIATHGLKFGSAVTLIANWVGTERPPRSGTYTVMTYTGDAPPMPAWTLKPPRWMFARLWHDAASKSIKIDTWPAGKGTIFFIK